MRGAVVTRCEEHQAQMLRHRYRPPRVQVVRVFEGFQDVTQVVGIDGDGGQVYLQVVAVDIAHQGPAVLLAVDPRTADV